MTTRLEMARREEREAAQAMHEMRVAGKMEDYARALQWHLRAITHRMLAEAAERRRMA